MRSIQNILLISLLFLSSLWAGGQICEFHATRQESTVLLEWATESEQGLSKFYIYRTVDQGNWPSQPLATVTATGYSSSKRSYSYIDNSIFKTTEANFYYKLVLVDQKGTSTIYPVIASVSGSSGFRYTWGSIKAMFR